MKENIYKTHNCSELRISDVGKEVRLSGWVNSIRRLGGIVFLTLRDHFGITQVLLKDENIPKAVSQVVARDIKKDKAIKIKQKKKKDS